MTGLPGKPPSHLLSQLFWAGVVTIGSMWRRLIRPYRQPPLCFALLVDPQMSLQSKRSLGSFLLTLPPCCRDEAFTGPVHRLITTLDDIISDDGTVQHTLRAAFVSKNHNIAVETNFGRASSMRQSNRGRTDRSYNMCSKHLLAEISHIHKRSLCRTDTQPHHVIQVEPGQHQALCEDGSGTSSQCLRSFSASAFRWDVVEFECAVVVISLFLLD